MDFHPTLTATDEETTLVEIGLMGMTLCDPLKAIDPLTKVQISVF